MFLELKQRISASSVMKHEPKAENYTSYQHTVHTNFDKGVSNTTDPEFIAEQKTRLSKANFSFGGSIPTYQTSHSNQYIKKSVEYQNKTQRQSNQLKNLKTNFTHESGFEGPRNLGTFGPNTHKGGQD